MTIFYSVLWIVSSGSHSPWKIPSRLITIHSFALIPRWIWFLAQNPSQFSSNPAWEDEVAYSHILPCRAQKQGDLQNTYCLMNRLLAWHTVKIPQLAPKPSSKLKVPDKWYSARRFNSSLMQMQRRRINLSYESTRKGSPLAFRGCWWIPHEVGSRLRPSTARVTASPADSSKKCKWCFFRCQYVGSAFEPTVDSQQC